MSRTHGIRGSRGSPTTAESATSTTQFGQVHSGESTRDLRSCRLNFTDAFLLGIGLWRKVHACVHAHVRVRARSVFVWFGGLGL